MDGYCHTDITRPSQKFLEQLRAHGWLHYVAPYGCVLRDQRRSTDCRGMVGKILPSIYFCKRVDVCHQPHASLSSVWDDSKFSKWHARRRDLWQRYLLGGVYAL